MSVHSSPTVTPRAEPSAPDRPTSSRSTSPSGVSPSARGTQAVPDHQPTTPVGPTIGPVGSEPSPARATVVEVGSLGDGRVVAVPTERHRRHPDDHDDHAHGGEDDRLAALPPVWCPRAGAVGTGDVARTGRRRAGRAGRAVRPARCGPGVVQRRTRRRRPGTARRTAAGATGVAVRSSGRRLPDRRPRRATGCPPVSPSGGPDGGPHGDARGRRRRGCRCRWSRRRACAGIAGAGVATGVGDRARGRIAGIIRPAQRPGRGQRIDRHAVVVGRLSAGSRSAGPSAAPMSLPRLVIGPSVPVGLGADTRTLGGARPCPSSSPSISSPASLPRQARQHRASPSPCTHRRPRSVRLPRR